MKALHALFLCLMIAACSDAVMSTPPPPPPPPPPPTHITVAYCEPYEPLWVAFQDGDGAWTRAQSIVSPGKTEFSHSFSTDRGAIATVIQEGPGLTSLLALYGTPEELTTVAINGPRVCGPSAPKTLLGTVAGLDTNELALIRSGFLSETVRPSEGSFALDNVASGPIDILATRFTRTNGFSVLSKIILRRGVDLPDRATLGVFDFGSPEAFAPVAANLTLDGVGDEGAFVTTRLRTSTFESVFFIPGQGVPGPVQPYLAIPQARLVPGDLQVLMATTHNVAFTGLRSATLYFAAPGDRALALGPEALGPTFSTVATNPALRIRAQLAEQNEYDREASITYQEDSTRTVTVSMTAAYAGLRQAGYDLVIPDLSGVSGFNPAWALTQTSSLRWSVNRIGGTVGLGLDPAVSEGAVRRVAFTGGVLTP